jgi:hypothetical protein
VAYEQLLEWDLGDPKETRLAAADNDDLASCARSLATEPELSG